MADQNRAAQNRADPQQDALGARTIATITWRLMPLLGLMYLIAYIDRQNVSYAKLQMVGDLGLSEAAYGFGASLFFLAYFLFEVPSNVILSGSAPGCGSPASWRPGGSSRSCSASRPGR